MTATPDILAQGYIASVYLVKALFERILSGELSDSAVIFQPSGSRSHILWQVGHSIWAFDALINPSLGGSPVLPEKYSELFRSGTQPVADLATYPSLRQLHDDFRKTLEVTISLLASKPDTEFAEPLPEGSPLAEELPNKGGIIPFVVYHTGYHNGQISMLRRLQGLPTGLGI